MKKIQWQQVYHYLQSHLKEKSQVSIATLSLITLFFCKQISGYLCNYNVDYWFDYFVITERFSMLLLTLSCYNYLKKKCWIILELLIFFLAQDFIDRVFFDIKEWNANDTMGLIFIGAQLIIKIHDNQK